MRDTCKGCGCTDDLACPEGCRWVKPGWCSVCHQKSIRPIVAMIAMWLTAETPAETEAKLGPWPCKIHVEEGPVLTVQDHIGAVVFRLEQGRTYLAPQYEAAQVVTVFENLMPKASA